MMKNINSFRFELLFCVLIFASSLSGVAQIAVTSLAGDDTKGSLVAAIQLANKQNATPEKPIIIRFDEKIVGEIVLSMDLPDIENHISILGNMENGKPVITINGSVNPVVNSGLKGGISPGFRLFSVKSGNVVSFENLHLTKSNKSAVTNEGGWVAVKNCMFTYNLGVGNINGTAGAIQNENGNLTVIGSYFFYNTGGVGGTDGGVGYGGAGCINIINGNAVVINSSFIENEGGFGGVGVGSVGGAGVVLVRNGNVSVTNCTVAGNFGGGSIVTGASGGFNLVGGTLLIQQSTIVDNIGGAGLGGFDGVDFCSGGIHVLSGTLILGNTILAGNHNGADEETDLEYQVNSEVRSLGNNILGKAKVSINDSDDTFNAVLSDIVETTSEGKCHYKCVSGFLPVISLTTNSLAKNMGTGITHICPIASTDLDFKFFSDAWSNYYSLLQADQNGKNRTDKPSIGSIE